MIHIYTDGGCSPNPGRGSWGYIALKGQLKFVKSGGFEHTTNNRMEIYAVLQALRDGQVYKGEPMTIYCDSKYVVGAMESWIDGWIKKNWVKTWKKVSAPVLNDDLWREIADLRVGMNIKMKWIKGHSGIRRNEECDAMCSKIIKSNKPLPKDLGYGANAGVKGDQSSLFD